MSELILASSLDSASLESPRRSTSATFNCIARFVRAARRSDSLELSRIPHSRPANAAITMRSTEISASTDVFCTELLLCHSQDEMHCSTERLALRMHEGDGPHSASATSYLHWHFFWQSSILLHIASLIGPFEPGGSWCTSPVPAPLSTPQEPDVTGLPLLDSRVAPVRSNQRIGSLST